MTIEIEYLHGNCPVQAEGTIDGKRFYFRARGAHWSLSIHETADGDYLEWPEKPVEWQYFEEWGDGPYDAGWMEEDEARQMIEKGAQAYRKGEGND